MKKTIEVKCPKCKKKFNYYSSKFRPFCTERCKMVDLGHWFEETYAVASEKPLSEDDIIRIEKELNQDLDDEGNY